MSYDVVVIGGGPAGAAAARRLATSGRRVLLAERQKFPRFHIGESLLPASNRVFETLGLMDQLEAEELVEKRGASFSTEDGAYSSYIDFTACGEVPAPVTYQVLRSRFDELLLAGAAEAGAEVRQECRVVDVDFEAERARVTLRDGEGERPVDAELVLDCSGQSGFLAKRLGLRETDPELRNVALYAHYEGVPLPAGERSGDIRIISRRDMSWFWLIPVSSTLTSVGIVMPRETHAARSAEPAEALLQRFVAATPVAAEQMRSARRVSEARFEADFCYQPSAYAGDRWLLAGDAGSFLDPVFSSGVLLALESGLEAAAAIEKALSSARLGAGSFAGFQRLQRRRYRFYRRFIRGFYDPAFRDLFFQPTERWGLLDAIVSALAGNWRPSWAHRARLALFFTLVKMQRIVPIAPRTHTAAGASPPATEPAPA